MDPVTHAALGAVVGQAVGRKALGPRAASIGAVAALAPDADMVLSLTGDLFDELVLHRGITHALVFPMLAGPLLGLLVFRAERWRSRRSATPPPGAATGPSRLAFWALVVALGLLSHALLDSVTSYGTQLLLPFSNARFAIDAMPIIDPLYTLILAAGLFAGARLWPRRATSFAVAALMLSSAYVGYAAWLNGAAEREATRQLIRAGIVDADVAAFPTLLQVHYRRVVARTADHDRVGFISLWRPCPIVWSEAPRDHDDWAVRAFLATREGRIFEWFTMGWGRYHVDARDDESWVRGTDLRYGFTTDPNQSIFSAAAPLDPQGGGIGPVVPARTAGEESLERVGVLLRDTYAAMCVGPAG